MSELYRPNINETLEDRLIRNEIKLGCINPYVYIEVCCTDTDDNKNENLKCVFKGFSKDFEDYGDMLVKLDYELKKWLELIFMNHDKMSNISAKRGFLWPSFEIYSLDQDENENLVVYTFEV